METTHIDSKSKLIIEALATTGLEVYKQEVLASRKGHTAPIP